MRYWSIPCLILVTLLLVVGGQLGTVYAEAPPFEDVSGDEFYGESSRWLHHAGIFIGDDGGHLRPEEPFTRAQMAVVLARMTGQRQLADSLASEATPWKDDAAIPGWARGAFVLGHMRGWFLGHDDGTVGPNEYLSWAEISVLLARITENDHLAVGDWPDSALAAGRAMDLYADIPHSPRADLPILRGQMTVAVWQALRINRGLDTDGESEALLHLHHGRTAQVYSEYERQEEGFLEVVARIEDSRAGIRIDLRVNGKQEFMVTDADGHASFRFSGLPPGEHRVIAGAEGYEEATSKVLITDDAPRSSCELFLSSEDETSTLTIEDIAAIAIPATVTVVSDESLGSGFHIGDGMVITNYHVVDGYTSLQVKTADGDELEVAGVYTADVNLDVAILDVPGLGVGELALCTDEVVEGQKVIAVGSPLGFEGTVTDGIVSARRDDPDFFRTPLIQTTAALSPGSSGGPLMNRDGEVVGINTLKAEGESLNFAIPVSQVESLVAEARAKEHSVALGDLLDSSLDIEQLNAWLKEVTGDSIFWASDVWLSDDDQTVLFLLSTDGDGCSILLDMAQDVDGMAHLEHLVHLIASHIHANTGQAVYGGISCVQHWTHFPEYLYEGGWEVWYEGDGYWMSRMTLLTIYFFDAQEYDYTWFPEV